ncbi:mucoidy inhibitor MuiA family protein, partial [Planctomycetota bacterium]
GSGRSLGAVLCLSILLGAGAAAGAEPVTAKGKIKQVTLYRSEALVTKTIVVDTAVGQVELRIEGLPPQVVGDSLFAEAATGIEVRAVRFRTRAVEAEPDEKIHALDQELEGIHDKLTANAEQVKLVIHRIAYLNSLELFVAPTASVELSKGVLDAATLEKITRFNFEQRAQAAEENLKLTREKRELEKRRAFLRAQRAELTRSSTRTVREALLFLEKREPGSQVVNLSYLVRNAGWSPSYNFRAGENGAVRVEANAIIQQMTGEDWNGVELVLSTASPGLSAEGPGLAPFHLTLGSPNRQMANREGQVGVGDFISQMSTAQNKMQVARAQQRASQSLRDNRGFNWEMNEAGNAIFGLELTVAADALSTLELERPIAMEEPSIEYRLKNPVSLASRSDQQLIRFDVLDLSARVYHVAAPMLTSYIYREAELTNTGSEALLAGPVSVYLDGRFVGRGEIPTVARGQSFVMGFGADSQLRARRELVAKTERVQGGNREVGFRYRIVLESYKDGKTPVRVVDRIPLPRNPDDVRVTLSELADPLSDDKVYLRVERPKGILRWEIEVPGHAAGDTARIVEYDYTMEFDKNRGVTTPTAAAVEGQQEYRQEFERMQIMRMGK